MMLSDEEITKQYALSNTIMTGAYCFSGCKFCYERYLKKLYPNVVVRKNPRYNDKLFDCYYDIVKSRKIKISNRLWDYNYDDGKVYHDLNTDFFDLGLNSEQIDKILGFFNGGYLHTTGLNFSINDANRVSKKSTIWLSAITFNDELRDKLFTHYKNSKKLLRLIKELYKPDVYLFCLNYEQLIEDIELINSVNDDCTISISLMDYNKYYPDYLKELSDAGRRDLKRVVEHLYNHNKKEQFCFYAPSEAYAWLFRKELKTLFDQYNLTEDDLILCSKASYNVIKSLLNCNVKYVESRIGGSVDFATALTHEDILKAIEQEKFNRVFVPSSIWWVGGADLLGNRMEKFKEDYPDITIVHVNLISRALKLEDCYNYYEKN